MNTLDGYADGGREWGINNMGNKHTPGPWKFNPESIGPISIWADCNNSAGREVRQGITSVGATYNHLDVTLYGEQNAREVADACLIAAAPAMLEFLHKLADDMDTLNFHDVATECRAVIARAEGAA